jgi:hypothetical protein
VSSETKVFRQAMRDLMYLDDHDALTGIASIIADRRAQIEKYGRDPGHDVRQHTRGYLARNARDRVSEAAICDKGPRHAYSTAGALLAAEIDRDQAMTRSEWGHD